MLKPQLFFFFCTKWRSSVYLSRRGCKRGGHSAFTLEAAAAADQEAPEAEPHLHAPRFPSPLFCLLTCAYTCLLHIKKTLKVATATKVIPRELIKFACAWLSLRRKRLESALKKKKKRSTQDHKRPKINGLLRRLWDSDTQAS